MLGRSVVVAWSLLVLACGESAPRGDAGPRRTAPADAAVPVATREVQRGTLQPRFVAPGTLVPRRTSEIGAEVTGRIDRVYVDVGDRVEARDLLFEIERASFEAAVREAEAALALAQAERRQVAADLRRGRSLRERQVLSQQALERLETRLAVARARERQAEAALFVAREQLRKTRVSAPYAGTIAKRLADEGTTARTMPQTIVVELQETGVLEARAGLPEALHARVRPGNRAELFMEGLPEPIAARVGTVADTVDPSTRTFLVRIPVPNPSHAIKAGAFVRVVILPDPRSSLVIPRSAVRSEAGSTAVLVVREGRAVEVAVQLGEFTQEVVEVVSGLAEGERVIVGDEAQVLSPGTRVVLRSAKGGAA